MPTTSFDELSPFMLNSKVRSSTRWVDISAKHVPCQQTNRNGKEDEPTDDSQPKVPVDLR